MNGWDSFNFPAVAPIPADNDWYIADAASPLEIIFWSGPFTKSSNCLDSIGIPAACPDGRVVMKARESSTLEKAATAAFAKFLDASILRIKFSPIKPMELAISIA